MSGQAEPILRGERTWLRPFEERDAEAYRSGVNDRLVGDPAGYKAPLGAAQSLRWVEERQRQMAAGGGYFFVICPLGGDAFIGTIWLHHLRRDNGLGELAIFVDREHLGEGWGTDAARAALRFGFGELRLERIQLDAYADNARAIRSYQKLGFVREGVMRHAIWHGGTWHDAVLMAVLRDDWAAQDGE